MKLSVVFTPDRISQLTTQCQDWKKTLDTVQEARARQQQHIATKVHRGISVCLSLYRVYSEERKVPPVFQASPYFVCPSVQHLFIIHLLYISA